jgi:Zn-dependent protease
VNESIARFLMWSFPIGRLFGIQIRIHWFFPVYIISEMGKSRGDLGLTAAWLTILFLTVLIHEFGHCFMARKLGQDVFKILLWPLGGIAYIGPCRSARDDIMVTLAGPVVHLPLALMFSLGLWALGAPPTLEAFSPFGHWFPYSDSFWVLLMAYGLKIQVVLFCFNLLLPVYPLDGGRVFVAFFATRWPVKRVAYVASSLSLAYMVVMVWQNQIGLALFVGVNALQLFMLAHENQLERHPMFYYAPRAPYIPRARPRHLSVVKTQPKPPPPPLPEVKPTPMEQDIDRILDKIRIEGMASLTAEEKNLLDEHSSRLRSRG